MIEVLSQATIDKIAAGEVVERPASIVKELLENAIDSGSSSITVEIKDGGLGLIRVTDKGQGIPKGEVKTAFLRHATSKLRTESDLLAIRTLGFRGEALSSIAAIATVEMITKPPADLTGVRYLVEYGQEVAFEEIGAPTGTTVIVRDVFEKIPARRKFLKSNATEAAHIQEMVEKLALAHPHISFKCMIGGQVKLSTPGNGKLGDVIYSILGKNVYQELLPFERQGTHLSLQGMIGRPALSRGNRTGESFFVNQRAIKSALLTKAVEEAYRPFMMQHRFPVVVLSLNISPELVDVNMHPRKAEVRFVDERPVYDFVRYAIGEFLKNQILVPKAVFSVETPSAPQQTVHPQHIEPFESRREKRWQEQNPIVAEAAVYQAEAKSRQNTVFEPGPIAEQNDIRPEVVQPKEPQAIPKHTDMEALKPVQTSLLEQAAVKPREKYFRLIGQLFQTYWLLELEDTDHIYMLDQHAVHEKILFERTMKQVAAKQAMSQGLLPAQPMTFTPSEQELLRKHQSVLQAIGFELEPFEGNEYLLRAVPANLFHIEYRELLYAILSALENDGRVEAAVPVLERIASISCKAAIKGNHSYSEQEISQMLRELLELENPFFCPHGRPTMVELTKTELEKKFKRIL
ncbi:MAG: DNA mismatch repair endonuclease MutL [Lachnospiraceae bacterium]|nr:DNA mismatch repair endonuclease MutL [Lachnospiraceae bacterium]MDY5741786.1 DNA mismatch repair endonuclease MutL [Lachnospiraceae bacterium]